MIGVMLQSHFASAGGGPGSWWLQKWRDNWTTILFFVLFEGSNTSSCVFVFFATMFFYRVPLHSRYSASGGEGIPSFLRDHLFVTTRVAVRDGNFLIGAPFVSDRPRHLLFRPKKSVLGPLDLFNPFLNFLTKTNNFFLFLFLGERPKSWKKKNNLHRPRVGGALALWAQRQNYRWVPGPMGPTTTL